MAGTVPRPWLAGQSPRQTEPKGVNKRLIGVVSACARVPSRATATPRFCGGFPDLRPRLIAWRGRGPALRALRLSPLKPLNVPVKVDRASQSRIPWGQRSLRLSPVRFGRPGVNRGFAAQVNRSAPQSAQPKCISALMIHMRQMDITAYQSYSLELAGAIVWLRKR